MRRHSYEFPKSTLQCALAFSYWSFAVVFFALESPSDRELVPLPFPQKATQCGWELEVLSAQARPPTAAGETTQPSTAPTRPGPSRPFRTTTADGHAPIRIVNKSRAFLLSWALGALAITVIGAASRRRMCCLAVCTRLDHNHMSCLSRMSGWSTYCVFTDNRLN
ncbi:hypothetical protein N658DRAFT_185334 [Parathielavia hyrcaniae]|uniref:Uncharacterized protein n=1 Tax=Parathielavia hyrcaniae TaxID=113614 RepID=A0AAN6Q6W7_9PEZI|nr:hypothetical protein N658DRAFT_185334 [Parathielavia hyrcaniae]